MSGEVSAHVFKQLISYRYELFRPARTPRPLLISLHGYGQTGALALCLAKKVRQDWPLVALQAPHPHHISHASGLKTGFGWVSGFEPDEDIANHHDFVAHVIAHAFETGLTDRPAAFLFGFSQAVSLNYRFAQSRPELVRGVIAVAGVTPSEWENRPVALLPPVLHLAVQEDEAYSAESNTRFKTRLETCARHVTWLEYPGKHRVPSASYPAIRAWLEAKV